MKKVFQIQIALKGVKPKVWRRVLVPSDVLLSDFHRIIQMSMGWTDTHLRQFYIKGLFWRRFCRLMTSCSILFVLRAG